MFVDAHRLPFVVSYGGVDILPTHPLRMGVLGTHGTQGGVDAVVSADTLLVLGCRLSVNTRGYNDEFIRGKSIIAVDIDSSEHYGREVIVEDVGDWLKAHTPSSNG